MNRLPFRRIIFLGLLTAAGCGATAPAGGNSPVSYSPGELEALRVARMDSMRARYSDADVRFATRMIAHHAQALEIAAHAATNGGSGPVRTLAARIISSQSDEIAILQRWLGDRGEEVPDPSMPGMVHPPEHGGEMEGMLTSTQLAELAAARGAEFDRLFLTDMIEHHRGAITMVEQLFTADGAVQGNEMFKLASDIQAEQRTEIARMQSMLDRM